MALNFEPVFPDADFLPSSEEMNNYKKKLEMCENFVPRKRQNIKTDEYDEYGRNITEQKNRQNKIKWTKVIYKRKQYSF
tara:strand:- start:9639 stop:9875 length:237 start_codon:yes stop_codon:yes gene_type:complete